MANELSIRYPTGSTLYAHVLDATGDVWNGSAFETPANVNWGTYDLAMSEAGTTGYYRVSMPGASAGAYSFVVFLQAGGAPDVGDTAVGEGTLQWDGSAEVALDEFWDEVVEGALTARQVLRLFLAALAGKSGGGGTSSITFRDNGDAKDRITATVDANGNRTAVSLDAS